MQIKRFHAQNMTEALRQVKKEFGPEAVILSARSLKKEGGFFGQVRSGGVEITAAVDAKEGSGAPAGAFGYRYRAYTRQPDRRENNRSRGLLRSLQGGVKVLGGARPRQKQPSSAEDVHPVLSELKRHLLAQGLESPLAVEVAGALQDGEPAGGFCSRQDALAPLSECLAQMGIRAASRQTGGRMPKTIVLLGTTGVGKTTSAGKIVSAESIQGGRRCALISLDTHQAGANARLGACAGILSVPLTVAATGEEFLRAVKRYADRDLILVDTPGISFEEDVRSRELLDRLAPLQAAERFLVLSATAKTGDLTYQLDSARKLGVDRIVLTKLDETRSYGDLISPLLRGGIPIAYFMNAPHVPEGIAEASVQRLAELLLYPEHGRQAAAPGPASRPPRPAQRNPAVRRTGFVANRSSDTFHRPDCRWVLRIKDANVVYLATAREAFERAYKPCRSCCGELQRTETAPEAGGVRRLRSAAQ